MKAVVLKRYGSNKNLEVRDVPDPVAGPEDVLIDLHAASVNPIDWKTRSGAVKRLLPYKLPQVLGSDGSGVVTWIGEKVTRFQPGDEVYTRPDKLRIGTFAERIAVCYRDVAKKPASLSHEEAASLPLVALTAWQGLVDCCQLEAGQKVFIQAGSGGVGTVAIQIAKALGASVATTAGARNKERLRQLGADVVVDYKAERFEDVLSDYDIVFDVFGGESVLRSIPVLRRGGHLVTILGMPDAETFRRYGHPILAVLGHLANRKPNRLARRHGVYFHYLMMRSSGRQLDTITKLVEAGQLRPVIDKVFPLAEVAEAFAYSEEGHATGKIVIQIRP
jgi:NADPH:quinone reductase-like Zn-dependent oxidoreductase